MAGYYFKLSDKEFENAATEISAYCEKLEKGIEQYGVALSNISSAAIISGEVHDSLVLFTGYVQKLKIISAGIGEKFSRIVQNFISDIEVADDYLYLSGVSSIRDFSEEEYQQLKMCLDDPWSPLTDSFGDWIYSHFVKAADIIAGFFHWDRIKASLHDCHWMLLDYNDETLAGLNVLFDNVHNIDRKYGAEGTASDGTGDYTYDFAYAANALRGVNNMMNEMAAIIEPNKGSFTTASIEGRLGGLYGQLLKDYESFLSAPGGENKVSTAEISNFASQKWATGCFAGFSAAMLMFASNTDTIDTVKMFLFQMFGITKTTLSNGENYNDYLTKKMISEALEDMAVDGLYSDSEYQESLEEMKTFLKYLKKGGKETYDYLNKHRYGSDRKLILDGRTIEAKEFNQMIESFDKAGDILKYGDKGIDLLSRALTDYSKGIEIIESFEANCAGDSQMLKSVQEIKALYQKEFDAWAKEIGKEIAESGSDAIVEALKDASPAVKVIKTIEKSIDLVGDISGLGDEAKSMYEATIRFTMNSSTQDAYINAVEKLRVADPASEEYSALANDVKNCFALHKKSTIEMFNEMADASHGTEKSYYRYCASKAENMSLSDTKKPYIMTYDEYLRTYEK